MGITPQSRKSPVFALPCLMLAAGFLFATSCAASPTSAQSAPGKKAQTAPHHLASAKAHAHPRAKKREQVAVAQAPPPPPMPHWPANETPNPASVVWNANGLRISASNSSLQQILNEVSTETGTKISGPIPDQRVYGDYGPGQAREVLSQLLQDSGCNILLAGDIGKGAPREIVLSPRTAGHPGAPNNAANAPQRDPDEDIPEDQSEDQFQPQPPPQQPQMPNNFRPGFGPNGPIRTPQQVIEEMQQRQLQQQQQMQQQMQQQQQQQNPQ